MTEGRLLDVDRVELDGLEILRVRGELDLTSAGGLQEAVAATTARTVVMDLSGVAFLDSAGIRTIDDANRTLAATDRTLLVVAPPDSRVAWTFRLAGFADDLLLDSVEAASTQASDPT